MKELAGPRAIIPPHRSPDGQAGVSSPSRRCGDKAGRQCGPLSGGQLSLWETVRRRRKGLLAPCRWTRQGWDLGGALLCSPLVGLLPLLDRWGIWGPPSKVRAASREHRSGLFAGLDPRAGVPLPQSMPGCLPGAGVACSALPPQAWPPSKGEPGNQPDRSWWPPATWGF